MQPVEFMPERRLLAMQSSGNNPQEVHSPWEMDVLVWLKETKETCVGVKHRHDARRPWRSTSTFELCTKYNKTM
jgi:hypothetical protein